MRSLEIFWDDLTDEAKERLHLLYHDNIDNSPIAIVDVEDLEDDKEVKYESNFFRKLSSEEELEFRAWARENYEPNGNISELWHPVVRDECEKINNELTLALDKQSQDVIEVRIKFRGIDVWSRPVFKTDKGLYVGSVNTLFPNKKIAPNNTTEEIVDYFREHLSELEYFGTSFNCEPHGGISSKVKFVIE
jgi:hypothetical protein